MGERARRTVKKIFTVLGIIFAIIICFIIVMIIKFNPRGIGVGNGAQRAETCRECHPMQYREWRDGQMAAFAAIKAPFSKGQEKEFARFSCWKCHDPFKLGTDEGVTCEYCHGKSGGRFAAGAQCENRETRFALLKDDRFCHKCHTTIQPITKFDLQGTVGEWEQSEGRKEGLACQDCHMPVIGEGEDRHHFHGHYYPGRNPLPDREGISIDGILKENGQICVLVKNHSRGHCLPTGAFTKAIFLEVKGFDENNSDPVFNDVFIFAKRFEFKKVLGIKDFPWTVTMDTRLKPGEERKVTFDFDGSIRIDRVTAALTFVFIGDLGLEPQFLTSDYVVREDIVF